MAIEHEGKYYEVVTDNSGAVGDLIHVSSVRSDSCVVWCFTTDAYIRLPQVDVVLSDGYDCLDSDADTFTRYREVQAPVEKAETLPKQHDTERYKVAFINDDTEVYAHSSGDKYVILTKYYSMCNHFTDVDKAKTAAEIANTFGIGSFAVYKEVASLVRLEDDNA